MARLGRPPHDDVLTPAEWRVCEAVRHGQRNRQIAQRLGISLDAVKYHVTNALQKLGFSSRAQLQRWDGVRKDSPLPHRSPAMSATPPALGAIGQIARTVSDIAAAEAWYRDVLGLRHLYTFGTLSFFDCNGVRLFLSQAEALQPESILYFSVADLHATCAALTQAGVEITHAPHRVHAHADGTEEWMAFLRDPDGRPLGLMSRVTPV
jgi:DNA-binding CsgD family transcriptional regulator/catechol 2,3-dioxygenase-like lactoylglutathione lyase family enzyme